MGSVLKDAMHWLAKQPNTLFIGQAVGCPGTKMSADFADIAADRRIEFPVAEEMQLGVCLGLSLQKYVPICVFPRYNFMMRAMDALVNHLDRIPLYSEYRPFVLIRTAVGSRVPLDAGHQHSDNFSGALWQMFRTVRVVENAQLSDYQNCYRSRRSAILVDPCS
jgi:pyruvate/2-oxoglutarate/acetoin dehydrogenase E1 component